MMVMCYASSVAAYYRRIPELSIVPLHITMLVVLQHIIEEYQSCLSIVPLHIT